MPEKVLAPIPAAVRFIDCINRSDVDGLADAMTDDHELIIFDESPLKGREANRDAWNGYCTSFPRYQIFPLRFAQAGDTVAVLGTTIGSHLDLPDEEESKLLLIWLAAVNHGRIRSWQLIEDTPANRERHGLIADS